VTEETKNSHNNATHEQLPEEPAIPRRRSLLGDRDF
jgi:hypothetical protein